MLDLSIVIVSSARTESLVSMTQQAINTSMLQSDVSKELILLEDNNVSYDNVNKLIDTSNIEFNYNKFLNIGIDYCDGEFIALCNNDLVFEKNWDSVIVDTMRKNKILSASPISGHLVDENKESIVWGYKIGKIVLGWCIVINRYVLELIGKLDESVTFWYSDNLYVNQLKKNKICHALICNSIVNHLCSKTVECLNKDLRLKYTKNQKMIFEKGTTC
ncbi:MAG: hypothetical protein PHF86_07700 [Candidatus Nanoarchaeia archaeon]|nr:hypothetical protein [Candidatus Nanoarchaeia archaeon]